MKGMANWWCFKLLVSLWIRVCATSRSDELATDDAALVEDTNEASELLPPLLELVYDSGAPQTRGLRLPETRDDLIRRRSHLELKWSRSGRRQAS